MDPAERTLDLAALRPEAPHPPLPPLSGASPAVHAVDDDARERAIGWLRHAAGRGSLTLDEFGERALLVYEADDLPALWTALRGLEVPLAVEEGAQVAEVPAPRRTVAPDGRRARSGSGLHLALFGSTARAGRWHLGRESTAVAAFGEVKLDLRSAHVDADCEEIHLLVFSMFGSVEITVPEGMEVDAGGLAVFGEKVVKLAQVPVTPGLPLLHVQSYVLFGAASVKSRPRPSEHNRRASMVAAVKDEAKRLRAEARAAKAYARRQRRSGG